ncbi:hypothetical protein DNFV4_03731 [Nitrospira tepida]|uniref:Uncharacterized protein n=1 Tax=Nitrospira tepida TaxID=2973512 RepID=A0AA86N261_9BACT|nr:hypothetical protein [Nitrospira tepida]CAI4033295.1 hypothetical protein DNFV4_03731 [Nitrospira tepida]
MNDVPIMLQWFMTHPLSGAAVVFGGAMVAVTVYTYLHDYKMFADGGQAPDKSDQVR